MFETSVGINTGYIKGKMITPNKLSRKYHPCVPGTGISRYGAVNSDGYILYDPEFIRQAGKLGRSLPPERFFLKEKILVVRTRNTSIKRRIVATIDTEQKYNLNRLSNIIARQGSDIYTLMGIIGSEFSEFIFLTKFFNYEIKPVFLDQFPVATASDSTLSELVKKRMQIEARLVAAKLDNQRRSYESEIVDIERKINARVYKLYQLTEDEVAEIQRQLKSLPGK